MFLGSSCCNIAENSTFARPLDFACRLNPSFHAFAEACATETLGGICVSVPQRQVVCEYDLPSERVAAGRRGAQGAEQWLKSNGKSPNRC